MRAGAIVVVALACLTSASRARAQSADDANVAPVGDPRRALISDAWARRNAGDHAGALDAATRAGAMRMVAQLRRFIAEEQLATGAFIDAWNSGVRCVREAETLTGDARTETVTACERLLRRLDSRVARVELRLPADIVGLEARIDGEPIANEYLRDPIGVRGGTAHVEVTAPGRVAFDREVSSPVGVMTSVPVELPSTDTVTHPATTARRPVAPWLFIGAGAAIVASGVFAGLYFDARGTVASSNCYSAAQCPADLASTKEQGERFGTISLIAGGVGAGLAITGLVFALTSRRSEAQRVTLLVGPRADGASVGVAGAF